MSFLVTFLTYQGSRETTTIQAATFSVDNSVANGLVLFKDTSGNLVAYFPSNRVESVIAAGIGLPNQSVISVPTPFFPPGGTVANPPHLASPNVTIVNSPNS